MEVKSMTCIQVSRLIDKYIDNRLEKNERDLFYEHIKYCTYCSEKLKQYQKILDGLNMDEGMKVPLDFAQNVMNVIYDLENYSYRKINCDTNNTSVFKRLGISMILTAAIMLLSFIIPFGKYGSVNSFIIKESRAVTENKMKYEGRLCKIDVSVESFFNKMNDTFRR